ncbi:amidohydrolase family protein [Arenibacter sp. M-2]|uniref:amidohydrolase family protein n=1 Tax=Arenibacter sp. M-2 TaxID=3053612 RepID=UPI0025704638|nr:amidohydrolase family protein [Arenibacter sp. M-2]MDL5512317.1 amidohydrolase family protein [Arenibacter sp. M-2]|tara:strand:- start:322 stop:1131 length:810 start_codon:yes stop_codon:yes gene_type:complete
MIIDVHTHINNYHEDRVVSLEECLNLLTETMQENKVDYSLVLSSYKVNEHRPSTKKVVEAISGRDNLGVVAGISYLNYTHRDLREISEFLDEGLIKGLKLYPGYEPFYPNDKRLQIVYDMAVEYDIPVMFHSGDTYSPTGRIKYSHPIHIDDVAVDFPDLKIVICHVGNPWIKDCMEVVYKNKNVYSDVSGLVLGNFSYKFERFMKNELEEMITYAGNPQYLLYGTDWPISNMNSYLNFMKQLDLPEEKKELILWKNAANLFKIDVTKL